MSLNSLKPGSRLVRNMLGGLLRSETIGVLIEPNALGIFYASTNTDSVDQILGHVYFRFFGKCPGVGFINLDFIF